MRVGRPRLAAVPDAAAAGRRSTRRAAHAARARGRTVVALAAAVAAGELVLDAGADRVDDPRGAAGACTASGRGPRDYVSMRALADPDVLLTGDLGVARSAAALGIALTDGRPDWAPWRSYATHHLWAAAALTGRTIDPRPTPTESLTPYAYLDSPLGPLFVARDDVGITALTCRRAGTREPAAPGVVARRRTPSPTSAPSWASTSPASGTSSTCRCTRPARRSSSGSGARCATSRTARPRSYGETAAAIGAPDAARAVGLANGQNPISIVVPCHRVVGANGSLTGYGGGLPAKQWLLAHEAAPRRSRSPDRSADSRRVEPSVVVLRSARLRGPSAEQRLDRVGGPLDEERRARSRSAAENSRSTKSAGSWRPGGRPMPKRTRWYSLLPSAADDRAQPVVPALAAAALEPQRAEGQVQLVVHHDDPLDRDLVERGTATTGPPDSFMNACGLASTTGAPASRPSSTSAAAACGLEPAADALGQQVEDQEAGVVPGARVARPGVAQADDQLNGRRPSALPARYGRRPGAGTTRRAGVRVAASRRPRPPRRRPAPRRCPAPRPPRRSRPPSASAVGASGDDQQHLRRVAGQRRAGRQGEVGRR